MSCCGVSGIDHGLAESWIGCLNSAMGFQPHVTWTEKSHARLYQLASEMAPELETKYPDLAPLYDRGWGVAVARTTQLAAVLMLEHPGLDAFWSCTGITKEQATEQVAAKSGAYWDAMMNGLAHAYNSEHAPGHSKNDGPIAAVLLVVGSVGTMIGFRR